MIVYKDYGASIAAYRTLEGAALEESTIIDCVPHKVVGSILKPSALPGEEPHGWRATVHTKDDGIVSVDAFDEADAKFEVEQLSLLSYDDAMLMASQKFASFEQLIDDLTTPPDASA